MIIHHDPRDGVALAAFKSEWWPASRRNSGRLQIGTPGRLRRNTHADVFMRLGGRVFARLPGYAGMRHGLKRPRLVLAPDRQPQLGAEHVGSLDQPLFTAASGSLTRTTPCLRLRITTPV